MQRFFATCPKGLEYLLRDELVALGAQAREALAGVHFEGTLETAYRACLWSRLASRILMPLAEFEAPDGEALYRGVAAVDWAQHFGVGARFAIDAHGSTRGITHSLYAVQRSKDAIVDQFRQRDGTRPEVDTEHPDLRLDLVLRRERAILSLDLSGAPLHQRGWRQGTGKAPLKENLAAAILLRARWPEVHAAGGALVDPLCGSATLLIEGAWMAADVAPGWLRERFGFHGWRGHDAALWQSLRDEAQARAKAGLEKLAAHFFGFDDNPTVLAEARRNAQQAGVAGFLHLGRQSLEHLKRPHEATGGGLLVCNPPYGQRLGDQAALVPLYRTLGERLTQEFAGWRAAVITSESALGKAIGLRAQKKYALFNGALECELYCFDLAPREAVAPRAPRPLSAGAEMVRNRLAKNWQHLRKRAQREGVHALRVYDADLPEYAAAVDVYEARPAAGDVQRWLHVQEYQAPASIPEDVARQRWRELLRAAGEALDVPRERIATKQRYRAKGGEKYGRLDQRGEFLEVEEGGLRFLVNLWDYLDTGLFLDHRPLRARVRELARGKRFLNLFCYTGAVSVYAAAGGAAGTTSVDLSATYLDWASRNLALNGFAGAAHRLVRADAMAFAEQDRGEYDLIFVDPPTFSNSKSAADFDVQRDHVRLLRACAPRLAPGGLLLFSNNFRRFRLDTEALDGLSVRDISASSIPFDFARNPRIHQAWELRPGSAGRRGPVAPLPTGKD
ncbi:MAG TPA: bifunctional 23S rRNA (guanine(2069)-N(7))-methyltransferase RlmK/23S rRNA (guanine(2445)-N(2))-methyltransferase RlmL [Rhodanobacteraceae bacterium]|nr:bifunctional 23S rRNA (guanine(2069)-N(7))-methyltransferase RlmK/23S rRNA (guanine(2445)-N(2))-methyltransferase RlmL [Rhodanobacteraceae bacterium]